MPNRIALDGGARLRELEEIVADGLESLPLYAKEFHRTGSALNEINREKLYKHAVDGNGVPYKTWAAYVEGRWGMGKSQSYRLMEAARLMEECPQIGDKIQNEAQAREMARVPDSQRGKVIAEAKEAAGSKKITADEIRRVRDEFGLNGLSADEKRAKIKANEERLIAEAPPRVRGETDHREEIGKITESLEKALKRAERQDYRKLVKAIQRAMDIAGETLAEAVG